MAHPNDYPYDAKHKITALVSSLKTLVANDPGQVVTAFALPVFNAVVETLRQALPNDAVVEAVRAVISPEQIALGEPIRAADALLVAEQLDAAIGPYPPIVG